MDFRGRAEQQQLSMGDGADTSLAVMQSQHMMVCDEWARMRQAGWYRRKRLFDLSQHKICVGTGFFIKLTKRENVF